MGTLPILTDHFLVGRITPPQSRGRLLNITGSMLSVINVCTNSIDDLDVAREEILAQLKDKKFLKNTVGIVGCHSDYIEEGVIGALHEALQFDIIGCGVFGTATNGGGGLEQLVLTILTSDDITFSTVLSDTITKGSVDGCIEQAYAAGKSALGGDPALIFMFGPIMADVVGDQMLEILDRVSGGVSIFGTLANDTSAGYTKSFVFKNGEYDLRKMALLMMHGNINPRFHVTAIASRNIQQNNAVVTGADGYLVTSINDIPVVDYLKSLGIITSQLSAVTMIPFLVDFGDGTNPVAYNMYDISADGAHCGGAIPKGATITFAEVDMQSVMETAETTLRSALADVDKNGGNGMFAIPCITRPLVLSPNVEAEITKSLELVGNKIPFTLVYSGGEICPLYNRQHDIVNRFHNLTYTLVVF